jgi:flagellar biosynthesis protein FlhF
MNVKRFIGRNSREAMQKVKAAFGDDAVVLSTKPAAEGGIEILAMAGESVPAIDSYVTNAPAPRAASVSLPTGDRSADRSTGPLGHGQSGQLRAGRRQATGHEHLVLPGLCA